MPQVLTGLGVECNEITFHIPAEYESARSGKHAPKRRGVKLEFPPDFSMQRVDSAQCSPVLLRLLWRWIGGTAKETRSLFVGRRCVCENIALLSCRHVEKAGLRAVGRGHPVRPSPGPGTDVVAFLRRVSVRQQDRAPTSVDSLSPSDMGKLLGKQELTVCAVEQVEEAIPIRLH